VQAVGNLITAYVSIYNDMVTSGEATTKELNAAYKTLMDEVANTNNTFVNTISSGASLDSGAIESLFNLFDVPLSNYYDAVT